MTKYDPDSLDGLTLGDMEREIQERDALVDPLIRSGRGGLWSGSDADRTTRLLWNLGYQPPQATDNKE
jgi:hypothetical protein